MTVICIQGEFILTLLNEVGRHRALLSHETDILQDLVRNPADEFQWTEELCRDLLVASQRGDGVRRFARRVGITEGAAYQKLHRMRRQARKSRKGAKRGVGR